ncbi:hypothetical protein [Phenylobacterium sp.]|jgi:hypothetical protein|uniref:hypothetical protein n=1 Tax=Phenylobacterium sp. TaxID=1871053 RepID=UPI002F41D824
MSDVPVIFTMWLGVFAVGIAWAFLAARGLLLRKWKVLTLGGCASVAIIFSTISALGLGHRLFGWMVTKP